MGKKLIISTEDLGWLSNTHPDLYYIPEKKHIIGELAFSMYYNSNRPQEYVISPDEQYSHQEGEIITDTYEIVISLNSETDIPDVFETGGRIRAAAKKWQVASLLDLHVYNDGRLCLCIPVELDLKLPNGFNLPDFFTNLLIPYFYYQSYFERKGKEPWSAYGHGDVGLLQSFQIRTVTNTVSADLIKIYVECLSPELKQALLGKRKFKGHHLCLCRSGRKIRKCHREAQFGFNSLCECYHAIGHVS